MSTLFMLWGIVLFGYILGGLASMLTNSDAQRSRYIHRLNTIREHLVRRISGDVMLELDDIAGFCIEFFSGRWKRHEIH